MSKAHVAAQMLLY